MAREFELSLALSLAIGCAEGGATLPMVEQESSGDSGGTTSGPSTDLDSPIGGQRESTREQTSATSESGGTQSSSRSLASGGTNSSSSAQLRTDILSLLTVGGSRTSQGGVSAAGARSSSNLKGFGGSSSLSARVGGANGIGGGVANTSTTVRSSAPNSTCCADGDCLCHGADPPTESVVKGTYSSASYNGATGTIYYPTDAAPPLAGVAVCGGFGNSGPEMKDWGPFYASWGIVTIITTTGALDLPDIRASAMLNAIKELKDENRKSSSPLFGKLSDRFGISGYSMGGGGTTIGTKNDPSLKTGVGLAPWGPVTGMSVPTLFLCGDVDTVAGVSVPQTATGTASMQVVISGYTHFNWFGPTEISGRYALAWQKVFLEGDTRWTPILSAKVTGVASMQVNLQ